MSISQPNETIILGIDPGTARIGYGVIRYADKKFKVLSYGTIKNTTKDLSLNLRHTAKEINKLIDHYKPDQAAIEKLFFFKNQKTVIPVAEFRGAIMSVLAQRSIPISEFTPLQVKRLVSGYGRAEKKQVHDTTRLILGIKEVIRPDDAADALAIAICGATSSSLFV